MAIVVAQAGVVPMVMAQAQVAPVTQTQKVTSEKADMQLAAKKKHHKKHKKAKSAAIQSVSANATA
ncbi:hypothetical protein [Pseudomonas sp. MWU13-2105]|uniref:hypothetical protein n=1 Tax=Pseudomonas sp. MWU13-2105 TaxID=2935074 RepID=UPI00200ECBF3|nr:hypothetical protein [Pseudomonas sp. MWU13-2105]